LDDTGLLIVMGGPMSVNDEPAFPWLRREKEFIRGAVERGVPVLGVCLGAQLIASALGAKIYKNPHKEIGWFPIEGLDGPPDVFRFPESCAVFHWHGETFDLPSGAVRLAKSAAYENQAFQIGRRVIGLQFHLEITPEGVQSLVDNCGGDLTPGPYIQTADEMLKTPPEKYLEINRLMNEVLEYLTQV
jgi:GMP synthase-like glutamine amidotransferase